MRAVLAWLIVALFVPLCAWGQSDFPALFRVTGVAANDVLNIRAGPAAGYAVIGGLAPGVENVEVIAPSEDGGWLMVNTGDRSGWVSARFMQRQYPTPRPAFLPVTRCFGTEPFWSFSLNDTARAVWRTPGQTPVSGTAPGAYRSLSDRRLEGLVLTLFDGRTVYATLRPEQCSDGMSDRTYGISVSTFVTGGARTEFLSGCCSIDR